MGGGDKGAREQEVIGGAECTVWVIFGDKIGDVIWGQSYRWLLYVIVNVLNFIHWAMGSQWREWQRGVEDTE
ncbi:unnamed protein product [Staurois parvus]|uniref:Uncharacterized protein n=1 Tax=Staurois parvus TaxID=386267 RepID=A0ABN9H7W8_9NEOB|nr:unnamed protein product [Staurois parvus]